MIIGYMALKLTVKITYMYNKFYLTVLSLNSSFIFLIEQWRIQGGGVLWVLQHPQLSPW